MCDPMAGGSKTHSCFDCWLGAQGLFDPIQMMAPMHGTPEDTTLPPRLDRCQQIG